MRIVVAYTNERYRKIVTGLKELHPNIWIDAIKSKEDFTLDNLKELNPDYIFLPHWSYYIEREIYEKYRCVIFHMTDLPFGRGGSPLQNLIARGIYETKISAIQCVDEMDAGPVYMKSFLSLHGSAEEIFLRASQVMGEMIVEIIEKQPIPIAQTGEVVTFKRRKREDGDIAKVETLEEVFNYIRMLDADGYPSAFLETEDFVLEFQQASLKQNEVHADVRIRYKREEE